MTTIALAKLDYLRQTAQKLKEAGHGQKGAVVVSSCQFLSISKAELYRQLESDLLLVPAAFTYTTGLAHWEVLLRARAIENLAFVVASAQGGKHPNGRRTYGNSMIINPWGDILNSLQEGEGMVIADCHAGVISERRRQLPALSHRVLI